MSNIYIQEPPTSAKVCLETTVGDIDIELWTKEAPKACRNFIQLCMEGYYDGTIFHRLVKGFIVQGGDPKGDGTGGNSIWGKPFKDEFHSRLRFVRRGLVAMANSGRDDNGSQFFFTLGPAQELQDKHTIFGKVGGNTIYNMIKLEESSVDGERPNHPHKILRTRILNNPFDDIVPRELIKKEKSKKDKKIEAVGTKNFKLLSFGAEAEEEEDEVNQITKELLSSGKGKSSHDLAKDPKLAKEKVEIEGQNEKIGAAEEVEENQDDVDPEKHLTVESVRAKLKRKDKESSSSKSTSVVSAKKSKKDVEEKEPESDDDGEYYLGKSEEIEKKKKLDSIKLEFKELKKEMKRDANAKAVAEDEAAKAAEAKLEEEAQLATKNSLIKEYFDTQKEYSTRKVTKKGESREQETMAILKKFQEKMRAVKETIGDPDDVPAESEPGAGDKKVKKAEGEDGEEDEDEDDPSDTSWLAKKFQHTQEAPTLAKDANLKSDDWFEIYDPRNPINKRRRGEAAGEDKGPKGKGGWDKGKQRNLS